MTNKEFIGKVAPLAVKAYKDLGKILPSVCIAMACCECGYGRAGSVKHNSLLGQKVGTGKTATKYWSGNFFKSSTKEEYTVGVHTVINAAFRAYDSWEQCIYNYYELLNTSLYSGVTSGVDYKTQLQQIGQKYFTSSTEVNTCVSIIQKYDLIQYDEFTQVNVEPVVTTPARYYTVVKGDSLWKISAKFYGNGIYWRRIADANNLRGTLIYPGQMLIIPKE